MPRRVVELLQDLAEAKAEIGQAFLVIAGWTLLTAGVATVLPHAPVWLLSGGLLFLSLAGWKWLYLLAVKGLYAATLEDRRG